MGAYPARRDAAAVSEAFLAMAKISSNDAPCAKTVANASLVAFFAIAASYGSSPNTSPYPPPAALATLGVKKCVCIHIPNSKCTNPDQGTTASAKNANDVPYRGGRRHTRNRCLLSKYAMVTQKKHANAYSKGMPLPYIIVTVTHMSTSP
jgi:hypothetical protein